MRAARAWGVKPTVFLTEWSTVDRTLAEASLHLEDSTPDHGVPLWDAKNPARVWRVETSTDFAAQARDKAVKKLQDRKTETSGKMFTVVDRGIPDEAPEGTDE
jgi:outer membrane receptor for monomeric catechols